MMTRAIIFDCFGVLASDGWLPFKKKYFGHDKALFAEVTDLSKQTDAGLKSYEDFTNEVAQLAKIPGSAVRDAIEGNPPNDELFRYITDELKPRYKIGMLSNAGDNWLPVLFTPAQIAVFDAVALSYETGVIKPDERAYRAIAERLGVTPQECVFVDDQERFCSAAREAGMQAIFYHDFEQTKRDLEEILGG